MKTTRFTIKLIAIFLSLIATNVVAIEAPASIKYPPYPDVWGYDLSSYPTMQNNEGVTLGYKMSNGDYWFKVKRVAETEGDKNHKPTKAKFNLIKFFEGTVKELSDQEREDSIKIMNRYNGISEYRFNKITFSNGDTLEFKDITLSARLCYVDGIRGSHLIKRDKDGKELGRYSIIVAMPKVQTITDPNQSEECSVKSKNGQIHQQLYPMAGSMVKLEDDTFIIFDDYYNIIVRFDQNLKTKFKPKVNYKTRDSRILEYNLFVVPFDFIDHLHDVLYRTEKPVSQGLQDGIMDYIMAHLNY